MINQTHIVTAEPITYTTEQIMEQAQVFASAWSLVGGCFDSGDQLEAAEQEKAELDAMVSSMTARLEQLETSNTLLASTDMAKTLDIVAIGEALGIPGEEQQGGVAEFLEAIEQLSNDAAVAAIQYAIENSDEEPIQFLRCWYQGDFDAIRMEWKDVPDEVFIGADPLFVATKEGE